MVVVVAAAALPYLNAIPASFAFDDVQVLVTNPFKTPGMSILDWFGRPTILGSVYRPLAMVSYELNALASSAGRSRRGGRGGRAGRRGAWWGRWRGRRARGGGSR